MWIYFVVLQHAHRWGIRVIKLPFPSAVYEGKQEDSRNWYTNRYEDEKDAQEEFDFLVSKK
jgi:hypothetical protein